MKFEDLKDDDAVVVCTTTDQPTIKDVTVRQCSFCGRDVWLADTTRKMLPKKYYLACMHCAGSNMQKEEIKLPSDEQLKDVADHLGIPFEQVKARIHSMLKNRNEFVKLKNRAEKYESN